MSAYCLIWLFFIYGFFGWCAEVAFAAVKEHRFVNRGFLNGPICPIYGFGVAAVISLLSSYKENLVFLYIASVIVVTVLEGITGYLLEKIFHDRWWDYSEMPLNIGGYVCLLFSLVWGVACVLIVEIIQPLIMKLIMVVPSWLGIILLTGLIIGILADVYVTAASILKMNRRLAVMEEVAAELHKMSEEIGENIYSGVMEAMDRKEEFKVKSKPFTDDVNERVQELKRKYQEAADNIQKQNKRIIWAFPSLKAEKGRGREALEQLKESIKNRKHQK